jgi:hypothetical protein
MEFGGDGVSSRESTRGLHCLRGNPEGNRTHKRGIKVTPNTRFRDALFNCVIWPQSFRDPLRRCASKKRVMDDELARNVVGLA